MPGMKGTMHEYKEGTLHSGSKHGPTVKSRAQAIAIGLSEERKEHKQNNSMRHAHLGPQGEAKIPHSQVCGSGMKKGY